MAFIIVAGVLLAVNAIFLIGSLIYTVKVTKSKSDPRLSTFGSVLGPRTSLQPQVVLYDTLVRISGNPELKQQHAEKTNNQSIPA